MAWTNPQSAYTINGDQITRSGTGWNAYCINNSGGLPATNPTITGTNLDGTSQFFAFTWTSDGTATGLPRDYTSGNWDENVISYGIYFSDYAMVRIDGVNKQNTESYNNTDVFTISMTTSDVVFKKNDVEFYTVSIDGGVTPDASKIYYLIGVCYYTTKSLSASTASAAVQTVRLPPPPVMVRL